jgi:hypothetical protein
VLILIKILIKKIVPRGTVEQLKIIKNIFSKKFCPKNN